MVATKKTVPGTVVLALCFFGFLAGRFYNQTSHLPEPQTNPQLEDDERQGRSLSEETDYEFAGNPEAAMQAWPAPKDPLDPVELERYMLEASGLLKVRPPLQPAPSGDNFVRAIPFQILSWFPRIVVYPGFVDRARCEHIINLAKSLMYPSGLAYRPGEEVDPQQQTRTSTGTFLSTHHDPDGVLAWIEERIAAISMIPRENGEPFNVLHYENMQHYDSHMDSFDPKDFGPQHSQRIATVLVYLSEPEEGGETVFKREGADGGWNNKHGPLRSGGGSMPADMVAQELVMAAADKAIHDWRNCNDGSFKYKPRLGDAVLFWSTQYNGTIDPRALHGSCPVIKGEKWAMTKWLRNKGGTPHWVSDNAL